tara:strand:+ start:303 stop:3323 length:3021 start_codon:yes stop_codon:yes gene_type:complete
MALKYLAGNKITGLASDTKPTTVPENSTFQETDTKKEFILISGVWTASGVGASIEGSEITAGTIPISKLATGTANKTIGFDASGNPAELAGASGVSPADTVTITTASSNYDDYERPLFLRLGKDNDLTKTPYERRDAGSDSSYLTFSDDFDPASAEWEHNGSTAYSAQSGIHLHTDYQSASTLDLRKFVGTASAPKPLSTNAWTLRFRFEWTDKAINTSHWGHMIFGVSSKDNTVFANQNQSFVGYTIKGRSDTSFYNYWGSNSGGQNPYSHAVDNNTTYNEKDISYCEISRQGDRYYYRLYADEYYEKRINEWSENSAADHHNQPRADSYTGNDSNQEMKYLKVMGYCTNTTEKNYIQGKVDNIKFWNGCPEAPETTKATYIIRDNDLWTENYYNSGKPRFGNSDPDTNIGDVAPNGTVFTRNNKWYDSWTNGYVYNSPCEASDVDTGSSQDGRLATNSSYPSNHRIDTTSSGNFGIGIYIDSGNHPLIKNTAHQFNHGTYRGNGSYGKPLKEISVWLWKKEQSAGNITGHLVMRVFNGGGDMKEHHRFTSHNVINFNTLSTTESTGGKVTFDMTGYAPRSGDYIFVESETTQATTQHNPNIPTYYESDGVASLDNNTHRETGLNSSNCIHMVSRYIEDNDLEICCRHYSTTSVTTMSDWIPKFEAKLEDHVTTKSQDYPIMEAFVGYPYEGIDRRPSANSDQYKDTKDSEFYEDNWTWQVNSNSNITWGTHTNPEHFYYKRRTDGNSTTQYLVNMRTEYDSRTSYQYPRKNTVDSDPPRRYWDYGTVAHRFIQVRVGSSKLWEVWVCDQDGNNTDPQFYGTNTTNGRNSTTNPWRKIAWGTEGMDYLMLNDRFRYIKIFTSGNHYKDNSNHYFYYAYDMKKHQQPVCAILLQKNADMTETQFEIQTCDDTKNETLNNKVEYTANDKWTTVRTINSSAMTAGEPSYIRIPVSMTSRIRIRGKGLNKTLSFDQFKVMYKTKAFVDGNHGHQSMSPTDATLNLDGTA